ncbi:MAG: hypothetical protein K6F98_06615 [Bacteroidales bacterium]|nr:hypothetical protein [Bacteroidales bacterium]
MQAAAESMEVGLLPVEEEKKEKPVPACCFRLMKNKEGTCLTATPSSLIHYLFNFYENTRCTKVVIISILCVEMSDFFGRLAMEGAGKAGITHRKKNTPCSVFFL